MYFVFSVILLLFVQSSQQVNENENVLQTISIDNSSNDNVPLSLNNTFEDLAPYNVTFEQYEIQNETHYSQTNESEPVETIVYAPIIIHLTNSESTSRRKNPLQHLLHGIVPHNVLRPLTHLFGHHHHHGGPLDFLNPFFYLSRNNVNGTQQVTTN